MKLSVTSLAPTVAWSWGSTSRRCY